MRIKQEPEDSEPYGNSLDFTTDFSNVSRRIKVEPGLEKNIKQEKEPDWSYSGLVGKIKTELIDPDQPPSTDCCLRCPYHSMLLEELKQEQQLKEAALAEDAEIVPMNNNCTSF